MRALRWMLMVVVVLGSMLGGAGEGRADYTDPEKCCVGGRPYTPAEMSAVCTQPCTAAGCNLYLGSTLVCRSAWFNAECKDEEPMNCTLYNVYPAPDAGSYQCSEVPCTFGCWLVFTCSGNMCVGGYVMCPPNGYAPSYNYCYPQTRCP